VIANHLRALNATVDPAVRPRVLLLHGGRCEGWPADIAELCPHLDISVATVSALEYDDGSYQEGDNADRHGSIAEATDTLVTEMLAALTAHGFAADQTLLHIHNHALGKNLALPPAVSRLNEQGVRLLLQIHDFAEDFRPPLYHRLSNNLATDDPQQLPTVLYPQSESIHYAVLNGRDRNLLSAAGVGAERLHWLPNPVAEFGELPPRDEARRALAERFAIDPERPLFLYPVRGIRRKNLGEMLLLSAAADGEVAFASTLTPLNPIEREPYDHWRQLAKELGLRCHFGLGDAEGLGFSENISAADAIVTTSVAEGFGMVFLEAWLAGRPLIGRNLPDITDDFVQQGLGLDDLYDSLEIPLEWIEEERFRHALVRSFAQVLGEYGREHELADRFDPYFDELIDHGAVDFGSLDVLLQREVISMVCESSEHRCQLRECNRGLQIALLANVEGCREAIDRNAAVIRENYSLEVFGGRLRTLYESLLAAPSAGRVRGPSAGHKILDTFLDLRRFQPVRTSAGDLS